MIINFSDKPDFIEIFKKDLISKGKQEITGFCNIDELWTKMEVYIKNADPNHFAVFNELVIITDNFDMTKDGLYRSILSYMNYTNKN